MVKKRKKDYQRKKLTNPFFSSKRNKSGKGLLGKIKIAVVSLLVFTGFFLLFSSDYFSVKNIVVSGNDRINASEIKQAVHSQLDQRRFVIFKQSNIFMFNKNTMENKLLENPLLEKADVKRKLPETLEVVIREKNNGLIWASGSKQYYLDLQGVAIRAIGTSDLVIEKNNQGTDVVRPEASSGNYPLVYDLSNEDVSIGRPATAAEMVAFISGLTREIEKTSDINISHYTMTRPYFPEVTLITKDGWEVRFKISDDYSKQARVLNSVLQQEIQNRNNLQYIDLRFGEKVFYK